MSKITITYKAPQDDSKVVEMRGLTFFDGMPVEVDGKADAELIAKAVGNPHFVVDGYTAPRRPGRPPKAPEPPENPESE